MLRKGPISSSIALSAKECGKQCFVGWVGEYPHTESVGTIFYPLGIYLSQKKGTDKSLDLVSNILKYLEA
jgi:hypothetical protein